MAISDDDSTFNVEVSYFLVWLSVGCDSGGLQRNGEAYKRLVGFGIVVFTNYYAEVWGEARSIGRFGFEDVIRVKSVGRSTLA